MMDGVNQSHYVKLTKPQEPTEDITPGELNQPIEIPQLAVQRCCECGQALPESYQPPSDENWTTGICGCAEDFESCWTGLFCPCVLFGRNIERLKEDIPWTSACLFHAICVEGGIVIAAGTAVFHGYIADPRTVVSLCEGLLFAWWVCGIYTGIFRQSLQRKYHLKDSPCDPCLVHCCMHWCAICQEDREMKGHLSDGTFESMTIVNPPPMQEMSTANDREPRQSSDSLDHNNMEIVPI